MQTLPMEGYWKFEGVGGLEVQISKGCRGEKNNIFQRETFQYRAKQQIDELHYFLVYSNAICTFSGHFVAHISE